MRFYFYMLIFLGLIGFILIWKRKYFFPKLKKIYNDSAIILLNSILLFLLLNIPFGIWQEYDKRQKKKNLKKFTYYITREDFNIAKDTIFNLPEEDIIALLNTPQWVSHPILEYMERPIKSKFYNVGFENMRYHKFANEKNANDIINNSVWMLGGSTTFGHGVADNHTLAAYLSNLDSNNTYINFGIQGYIQNTEIEKLILLLKKGYRPKKVIFLDGLNDIARVYESDFLPEETPINRFSAHSFAGKYPMQKHGDNYGFLRNFPIIAFFKEKYHKYLIEDKIAKNDTLDNFYDEVYTPNSFYHSYPEAHFWSKKNVHHRKLENHQNFREKIIRYYKSNLDLIEHLAAAYDFEYVVYFQPLGCLYPEHALFTNFEKYKELDVYHNIKNLFDEVKLFIKSEENIYNFIDVTDLHFRFSGNCYLDLTHYTPEFNEFISKEFLKIDQGKTE